MKAFEQEALKILREDGGATALLKRLEWVAQSEADRLRREYFDPKVYPVLSTMIALHVALIGASDELHREIKKIVIPDWVKKQSK